MGIDEAGLLKRADKRDHAGTRIAEAGLQRRAPVREYVGI
jgi:hypothetical protein